MRIRIAIAEDEKMSREAMSGFLERYGRERGEWAFDGMILTDNANTGVFMDGLQMIEAGADMKLTYAKESARFNWDPTDPEQ